VAALVATVALAGCSSSHTRAAPSTAGATSVPPASAAAPAAAAPTTVGPDALRSLLVTPSDLPRGFAPGGIPPIDGITLAPCGRRIAPMPAGVPQAQAAFARTGTQEQVLEQVGDLGATASANLVDQVRQVATGCPQFDLTVAGETVTLLVTTIQPPPAGDGVAGVQLATSAMFADVVVIRSGALAALVVTMAVGNPMPPATLAAIVSAAGRKLAPTAS
jgi:hypothetical protein